MEDTKRQEEEKISFYPASNQFSYFLDLLPQYTKSIVMW